MTEKELPNKRTQLQQELSLGKPCVERESCSLSLISLLAENNEILAKIAAAFPCFLMLPRPFSGRQQVARRLVEQVRSFLLGLLASLCQNPKAKFNQRLEIIPWNRINGQ